MRHHNRGRRLRFLQVVLCLLLGARVLASAEVPRADASLIAAASLQGDARQGKSFYAHRCIGCHGAGGYGDPFKAVPALAGQRYEYLVQQISRFVANDRSSTPMLWAFARQPTLEPQASVDIAAYLSNLPPIPIAQAAAPRDLELGARVFHKQCAACHGEEATGSAGSAIP